MATTKSPQFIDITRFNRQVPLGLPNRIPDHGHSDREELFQALQGELTAVISQADRDAGITSKQALVGNVSVGVAITTMPMPEWEKEAAAMRLTESVLALRMDSDHTIAGRPLQTGMNFRTCDRFYPFRGDDGEHEHAVDMSLYREEPRVSDMAESAGITAENFAAYTVLPKHIRPYVAIETGIAVKDQMTARVFGIGIELLRVLDPDIF